MCLLDKMRLKIGVLKIYSIFIDPATQSNGVEVVNLNACN